MKFQELKENEPLRIIEVSEHVARPVFPALVPSTENQSLFAEKKVLEPKIFERVNIQMRLFTDGEILGESQETSQSIEEYYIGKEKYEGNVDTLKTKNLFFKNHSYVITYLIASGYKRVGNVRGNFNTIKDISIYLQNSKDRGALKRAKQVIKEIEKHNRSVDYSSTWGTLFSHRKGLEQYEIEQKPNHVYCLKMKKK